MEIRIPEVGESVREALLAKWFKANGDIVRQDEPVCEIETDKITLDLNADCAGILTIMVHEGVTAAVGAVIGRIDEIGVVPEKDVPRSVATLAEKLAQPVTSPSVRREMRESNVSPRDVTGSGRGGRITRDDLQLHIEEVAKLPPESRPARVTPTPPVPVEAERPFAIPAALSVPPPAAVDAVPPQPAVTPVEQHSERSVVAPVSAAGREERRQMSPIRKRIAERLVAALQQTAMLTTFNEADLSHVKKLRAAYREHFLQRHGAALGLMPFFVKACIEALKEFPAVNARIDGNDIVQHNFYDIGVAVGSDKGLVVPVLRSADHLKMYEIDRAIAGFAEKINSNHLTISDLEGGTFTISNGGVYGSMLSTPIINPPQSAVLGMHAIQDRPVVRDGEVVVRPMMYLALSYDHRIIDGREAVGFLKKVVEYIEEPEELLLES